jgi:hypothetical protein
MGAVRHNDLENQVDSLEAGDMPDASRRLQLAYDLLDKLVREPADCLRLAVRLAKLILHEVIDAEDAPDLDRARRALAAIHERSRGVHPPKDVDKARCLIGCFAALRGDPLPDLPIADGALQLLPLWVEQHRLYRDPAQKVPKGSWDDAMKKTLRPLAASLKEADERRTDDERLRNLSSIRNAMSLWLCLELLRPDADYPLRAVIAYELREALRFICFEERRHDLWNQCKMVAAHAEGFVTPCEVNRFLRAVYVEGGINHYPASDHLRHVLDVYLAGHYFMALRLARPKEKPSKSVADALFGRLDTKDGLAAFSLAALFHDVDMLFLVDRRDVGSQFIYDAGLPDFDRVGKVVDGLLPFSAPRDAVAGILQDVRAALGDSIAEDTAPPAATADGHPPPRSLSLLGWIQWQEARGKLEHGVLSAWFMQRLCPAKEDFSEVVQRAAMRAILLHEALDVTVALELDPVAGLLVLCNEIFVWSPRQIPTHLLDHWINPAGVRLELDESQERLLRVLEVEEGAAWPRVQIALKPDLPLPLWAICLRKAPNLGRLEAACHDRAPPPGPGRFSPVVEVIATKPASLQGDETTTRTLLQQELASKLSVQQGKPQLLAWLKALPETPTDPAHLRESMILGGLGDRVKGLSRIDVEAIRQAWDAWEQAQPAGRGRRNLAMRRDEPRPRALPAAREPAVSLFSASGGAPVPLGGTRLPPRGTQAELPPPEAPPIHLPDPLLKAYRGQKLALFVGSGLSLGVPGKFPSWSELPLRLLDACERYGVRDPVVIDLKRRLFALGMPLKHMLAELGTLRALLDRHYPDALADIFRPKDAAPGPAHRAAAALGVGAILTTNYDQLFELLQERPFRQPYSWKEADRALLDIKSGRRVLFKIHGTVERHDTVVMSDREYDGVRADATYKAVLGHLLEDHVFLFLGYGMNDPLDLDLALKGNADAFKSAAQEHYVLFKDPSDRDRERFLDEYDVRVLAYTKHDELPAILERLAAAKAGDAPPR